MDALPMIELDPLWSLSDIIESDVSSGIDDLLWYQRNWMQTIGDHSLLTAGRKVSEYEEQYEASKFDIS